MSPFIIRYFRRQAKNVQSKVEECIGFQLSYNLRPGDSVFQSFDASEEGKSDHTRLRKRSSTFQDDQLLNVAKRHMALRKASNSGLQLVADYLRSEENVNTYDWPPTKPKLGIKRSNSAYELRPATKCLNPFMIPEYKEYCRFSKKGLMPPKIKKFLSPTRRHSLRNIPIIIVTNHA